MKIPQRARRGVLAAKEADAGTARAYGRYLVQRNLNNRAPRWLLPALGMLLTLLGLLFCTGPLQGLDTPALGVIVAAGGAVVTFCGVAAASQ